MRTSGERELPEIEIVHVPISHMPFRLSSGLYCLFLYSHLSCDPVDSGVFT